MIKVESLLGTRNLLFFFVYSEYVYCDNCFELKANHRNLIITRVRLYLQYIRDSSYAGTKNTTDRVFVHTWERWFYFGAISVTGRSCAAQMLTVDRHISHRFLCHCLALCEQVFILKPNSFLISTLKAIWYSEDIALICASKSHSLIN